MPEKYVMWQLNGTESMKSLRSTCKKLQAIGFLLMNVDKRSEKNIKEGISLEYSSRNGDVRRTRKRY